MKDTAISLYGVIQPENLGDFVNSNVDSQGFRDRFIYLAACEVMLQMFTSQLLIQ